MSKKEQQPKTISLALAKEAMADYIKASALKAKQEAKQKLAKSVLEQFAKDNKVKFNEEGNYKLPGGYLHWGEESVIVPCEGFNLVEFVKAYPELVDRKFKTAPIKAMLATPEGLCKLTAQHCVAIEKDDKFSIVLK
jgi:hypothetical protein